MTNFLYINDRIINYKNNLISTSQRGFLYGDGVFESCKIFEKKIVNFNSHLLRLESALQYLKISNVKEIIEIIAINSSILIDKNNCIDGILRISISRGEGSEGYLPIYSLPLIVIETKNKSSLPPKLIKIGVSFRNPPGFFFKSHSALSYVMTKIEAQQNGYFDNIMIDDFGNVCETSSANIFWIKNNKIFTTSDDCRIVRGCIRKKVLELENIYINKVYAKLEDIIDADELFLTNANYILLSVDCFYYNYNGEIKIKNYVNNMTQEIKINLQKDLEIIAFQ